MPLVQVQQGEPFKHCSGSAFLLHKMLNTELRSRWQRLRSAAGGGKSKQGLAQRSAFLQEYEQKKAETARGCVTRFTMPLVQAGQGEPHWTKANHLKSSPLFIFYPGKPVFGIILNRD